MAYGRYKSYAGLKSSYSAGNCKISVNHFQIHELLKNVKSKVYLYFIYSLRIIFPIGTILLLNRIYPTKWVWIPLILHLLVSYLIQVQMAEFSIGGIAMLIGFMKKNGFVICMAAPFVVEFLIGRITWSIIESTVTKEVMEDKEHFDKLWEKELILYESEDMLYSATRSVRINRNQKSASGLSGSVFGDASPIIPVNKDQADEIARKASSREPTMRGTL
ncbi:MAG: hypothetical protein IKE33_05585 [Erysipelotrichaceae bacterium]|nr:hypothetical protein [Erysipelotrichaceae bacterium]